MTAAEHLSRAEQLLAFAVPGDAIDTPVLISALAHGVLAIAIELGVPPAATQTRPPESQPPLLNSAQQAPAAGQTSQESAA